jgi:hypothetical protein
MRTSSVGGKLLRRIGSSAQLVQRKMHENAWNFIAELRFTDMAEV